MDSKRHLQNLSREKDPFPQSAEGLTLSQVNGRGNWLQTRLPTVLDCGQFPVSLNHHDFEPGDQVHCCAFGTTQRLYQEMQSRTH